MCLVEDASFLITRIKGQRVWSHAEGETLNGVFQPASHSKATRNNVIKTRLCVRVWNEVLLPEIY